MVYTVFMASRRKGKSSRPPPGRNGSLDSTEEVFVPVLDIGGDSVPKDAYIALKRGNNRIYCLLVKFVFD